MWRWRRPSCEACPGAAPTSAGPTAIVSPPPPSRRRPSGTRQVPLTPSAPAGRSGCQKREPHSSSIACPPSTVRRRRSTQRRAPPRPRRWASWTGNPPYHAQQTGFTARPPWMVPTSPIPMPPQDPAITIELPVRPFPCGRCRAGRRRPDGDVHAVRRRADAYIRHPTRSSAMPTRASPSKSPFVSIAQARAPVPKPKDTECDAWLKKRPSPLVAGRRAWNAGICCAFALRNDVGYLVDVVNASSQAVPVDATRVYVVGFSNGGMMALRAICSAPVRFRRSRLGVRPVPRQELRPPDLAPHRRGRGRSSQSPRGYRAAGRPGLGVGPRLVRRHLAGDHHRKGALRRVRQRLDLPHRRAHWPTPTAATGRSTRSAISGAT